MWSLWSTMWPEPEGKSQGAFRPTDCGLHLMCIKEWKRQGVVQWSVRFRLTHSGAYCPVSQLNDVMFHLRPSVMLKSVVCAQGGERQPESCKSGFCEAFVCWVWEIKADSCNSSVEDTAQTSIGSLFYLTTCSVRPLHQLKTHGMPSLGGEQVGAGGSVPRELMPGPTHSFPLGAAAEAAAATEMGETLPGSFLYSTVPGQKLGCAQHTCPVANAVPWSYLTMEFIQIAATPPPASALVFCLVWVSCDFDLSLKVSLKELERSCSWLRGEISKCSLNAPHLNFFSYYGSGGPSWRGRGGQGETTKWMFADFTVHSCNDAT